MGPLSASYYPDIRWPVFDAGAVRLPALKRPLCPVPHPQRPTDDFQGSALRPPSDSSPLSPCAEMEAPLSEAPGGPEDISRVSLPTR